MARLFDDASSEYAEYAGAVVSSYPLTMACWFRTDSVTINQMLMSIVDNSNQQTRDAELGIFGTVGGDPLRARKDGQNGSSVGTVVANQWMHAAGVFEASQVTGYLDGTAGTPNAQVDSLAAAADTTSVGRRNTGAAANLYMSGRIAEAAIWNVALSAASVSALSGGSSPLTVRPDALVAYWPLWGTHSTEIDLHPRSVDATDYDLTLNGTTSSNGPPVVPFSKRLWLPNVQDSVATGGGGTILPLFNHYQCSQQDD